MTAKNMASKNTANKDTYQLRHIVRRYAHLSDLFLEEKTILRLFKKKLTNMRMLDIGVGGGRTTSHFAPLVKEYLGIDYSRQMIDACENRFPNHPDNISFKLCDVRSMRMLKNNHFDFVLVSSNGLDYMPHADRIKAMKEIKRVGKRNGHFFFSTHNLLSIDELLHIEFSLNPVKTSRSIIRHILLKTLNKELDKSKREKYAIINDGAHQFRLLTYYITPREQIRQLSNLGFKNIRVFSSKTGREIVKKSEIYATTEGIHNGLSYLCDF